MSDFKNLFDAAYVSERKIRHDGIAFAEESSIKLTIRDTYAMIDILRKEVGLRNMVEVIDADIADTTVENEYRRYRLFYTEMSRNRCFFERCGSEIQKVYKLDFRTLAVCDLIILCIGHVFTYFSIECNTAIFSDPSVIRQCLENRTFIFSILERELIRETPHLRMGMLRLRVVDVNDLLMLLIHMHVYTLEEICLKGVHTVQENFDTINLAPLRGIEQWVWVGHFQTHNLICIAKATDLHHFITCEILVRSFDEEEIINLGEALSVAKEFKKIVITSITDFDWNALERELQEDSEVVGDQKDDVQPEKQQNADEQNVEESKDAAEMPHEPEDQEHRDDQEVEGGNDAAEEPQQVVEAPVLVGDLYKEKMFDNGVRCRMYKNILEYTKI